MPDPIFPRDTYRPGDHEYDLDHLFDGEEEDGSLDLLCRLMETKPPLPEGEEEPEIIPGSQIERFLVCMMHGKNSDAYREVCQSAQKNLGPRAASSPQNAAWVKKKRTLLLELVADSTDRFTDAEKLRAIELEAYLDGHQPNKFHPAVLHFQVGVFLRECGMEGAAAE